MGLYDRTGQRVKDRMGQNRIGQGLDRTELWDRIMPIGQDGIGSDRIRQKQDTMGQLILVQITQYKNSIFL